MARVRARRSAPRPSGQSHRHSFAADRTPGYPASAACAGGRAIGPAASRAARRHLATIKQEGNEDYE
jgi:hypothetical protein